MPERTSRRYELQSSFTFSRTRLSKNRCGSLTHGKKKTLEER